MSDWIDTDIPDPNDIVERLKDCENATHALFGHIFHDSRKEIIRLRTELSELRAKASAAGAVPIDIEEYLSTYEWRTEDGGLAELTARDRHLLQDFANGLPLYTAPPTQAVSDNWEEAHKIIGRLMSSDVSFEDCTEAADFIRRIVADQSGPDGFATWKVIENRMMAKADEDSEYLEIRLAARGFVVTKRIPILMALSSRIDEPSRFAAQGWRELRAALAVSDKEQPK